MDMLKTFHKDVLIDVLSFLDSSTLILCVASLAKIWRRYTAETIMGFRSLCLTDLQKLYRLLSLGAPLSLEVKRSLRFQCTTLVVDLGFEQLKRFGDYACWTFDSFPQLQSVVVDYFDHQHNKQSNKRIRTSSSSFDSLNTPADDFMESLSIRFGGNARRLVLRGKMGNHVQVPHSFIGLDSFDFSGCLMPLDNDKVFSVDSSSTSVVGDKLVGFLERHQERRQACAESLKVPSKFHLGTQPYASSSLHTCPLVYRILNTPNLDFVSIPLSVFFDAEAYHQRINSRFTRSSFQTSDSESHQSPRFENFFEDAQVFRRRQFIDFNVDLFLRFCSLHVRHVALHIDACVDSSFFTSESFALLAPRLQTLTISKDCNPFFMSCAGADVAMLGLPRLPELQSIIIDVRHEEAAKTNFTPWLLYLLQSCSSPCLDVHLSHLTCSLSEVSQLSRAVPSLFVDTLRIRVDTSSSAVSGHVPGKVRCNHLRVESMSRQSIGRTDLLVQLTSVLASLWSPGALSASDMLSKLKTGSSWRRFQSGSVRCSLTQWIRSDDLSIMDSTSLLDEFRKTNWIVPCQCSVLAKPSGQQYVQVSAASSVDPFSSSLETSSHRSLYSFSPSAVSHSNQYALHGTQRLLRRQPEKRHVPNEFVLLTPF